MLLCHHRKWHFKIHSKTNFKIVIIFENITVLLNFGSNYCSLDEHKTFFKNRLLYINCLCLPHLFSQLMPLSFIADYSFRVRLTAVGKVLCYGECSTQTAHITSRYMPAQHIFHSMRIKGLLSCQSTFSIHQHKSGERLNSNLSLILSSVLKEI